jgi:hypothetical protein
MKKLERLKKLLEANYQDYQEMYYGSNGFSITIKRYGKYDYNYQIHDKSGWYSPDWKEDETISFLSLLNDVLDDKIIDKINTEIPEFELELNYLINLSIKNDDFYWVTGGNRNWYFGEVIDSIYAEIENIVSEDEEYSRYGIDPYDIDISFLDPDSKKIYDDFLEFFKSHTDFRDIVNLLKRVKSLKDFQKNYKEIKTIIGGIILDYINEVAMNTVWDITKNLKKGRR